MGQAAAQITDQRHCKGDQTLGDAGSVHQLTREDEEGHGHEGEHVQALEVALGGHCQEGGVSKLEQADCARYPQDHPDRHAEQHQSEKCDCDHPHGWGLSRVPLRLRYAAARKGR
ncbi:hypothetical protein SDC9_167023 [bioreactor metagenome]|uniref:Uncharacterized protein n=1 Tax=bioreactor metagenome TaxID=1076179 RepID=A0A645FYM3_9ZZZZ